MLSSSDFYFQELYEIHQVFERTRRVLLEYLARHGMLADEEVSYLAAATLTHVERMQKGLKWTLRASEAVRDELRYLVRAADTIDTSHSPDTFRPRSLSSPEWQALQAVHHAKVVFGTLPHVPNEQVTYPLPRTYADITPPRSPAELSDRIDELERGVWDTAVQRPLGRIDQNLYRRVYGFFEVGAWLAEQHLKLFRPPEKPN